MMVYVYSLKQYVRSFAENELEHAWVEEVCLGKQRLCMKSLIKVEG